MLKGELTGADDRLPESTLRAFDQWFTAQVDSVRQVAANTGGRPDYQRASGSDDSERGSSPEAQRQASVDSAAAERCRSPSTGDVDVDSDDKQSHPRHSHLPPTQSFNPVYDQLPAKTLPVLPNRNAVYVADAILPPDRSRDVHYGNGVNGKSDYNTDTADDDDDDLEVVLPSSSPSPTREAQTEDMEFASDDKDDHASPEMDTLAQEEATDLSLPKQNGHHQHRKSSASYSSGGAADYSSTGGSSGSEDGSGGGQSPMMPAPPRGLVPQPQPPPPPHNFFLNSSAALAAAGLLSQSLPFYNHHHHQRALQLANMSSRAAALGIPFYAAKDVTPLSSKPAIRSAHGYPQSIYSSSPSSINAGNDTLHTFANKHTIVVKCFNQCVFRDVFLCR